MPAFEKSQVKKKKKTKRKTRMKMTTMKMETMATRSEIAELVSPDWYQSASFLQFHMGHRVQMRANYS